MRHLIIAAAAVAAAAVSADAAAPTAYPAPARAPIARPAAWRGSPEATRPPRAGRRPPIQEALGLTDEETRRLEEILRAAADERREARQALGREHRRLAEMVEAGASSADLRAQLDRLTEAKRAAARAGEAYEEILALLGPERTARFALMGAEFRIERRSSLPGWRGSTDPRWRSGRARGMTW